ncbi:hypothetical protein Q8F55_003696 [Vanrija albida]|uniref:beta-glucosidase n=1 Tax=Vanrija albida TaxID=181172 RepID=A0ABR3Q4X6_9TREE
MTAALPPSPPLSSPSLSKVSPSPWHTGDRSFLDADVDELLAQLTRTEKITMLAGADWWHTVPVPRLNIPGVKMSDGPNGARGASFAEQTAGIALPCETALAATFNTDLVHAAGRLLASEAKDRGAVALLAPTINIQRSPLGGRSFESFTEDPILSGILATAYINGLQENGVSAVLKHYVANDIEHERTAVSSEVSERALREVYLRPFQIAVADSNPLAIMSSYNRVNGEHVSESKELLDGVLRKQWGWDGLVMSDWFGTYSVDTAIKAGQDLEMPGTAKWRTPYLVEHLLAARKISERDIDACVRNVLVWAQRTARMSPATVYGDDVEVTNDRPEDRVFLRELGAKSNVLLKNEQKALPLTNVKRVAVVGPRALDKTCFGGGSAQLNCSYVVTVLDGIKQVAPEGVSVEYSLGTSSHKMLPYLDGIVRDDGIAGADMRLYSSLAPGSEVVHHYRREASHVLLNDGVPDSLQGKNWFAIMSGKWTAPITGAYEFSLAVCGRAKLYVDGVLVVDNWDVLQTPGETFFGHGTSEEFGQIDVVAGKEYSIRAEFSNIPGVMKDAPDVGQICNFGLRIGGFPVVDKDAAIEEAVALAKEVDAVVVAVGLSPDWESESYDRASLALPQRTNELVSRIAAANPRTVVAVQSGSAVSMPWVDDVAAVVQAWYGGNASGLALADVLFGNVNPSGRLPITFPVREEDIAAHGNFRSANGKVLYSEDLAVGYKWFLERKLTPLFPFGHGLSYSTFGYSDVEATRKDETTIEYSLAITNTGDVAGSTSAQVYLSSPVSNLAHPIRHLAGIATTGVLAPGASERVAVTVTRRELAHWDDLIHSWSIENGKWKVFVSDDALAEEQLVHEFVVKGRHEWSGL